MVSIMNKKNNKPEIKKIGSIDVLTLDLFLSNKGRVYLCVNEGRGDDHLHNVGKYTEIGQYGKKREFVPNKKALKSAAGIIYRNLESNIEDVIGSNIKKYFEGKK